MKHSIEKYKTRKAQSDDFQIIFDIKKEALFQYVDEIWGWDETDQINLLKKSFNKKNFSIIEVKELPAGILQIEDKEDCIDLINLELREHFRSKGIGSSLIDNLKVKSEIESKPVKLRVFKKNKRAITFYNKHGFSRTGETDFHFEMKYYESTDG